MLTRNRLMILAAPLALAACDDAETNTDMPMTTEDMPMADGMPMDAGDMPMMQADGSAKIGSADGTVTAIGAAEGTITINHGAVASIGWPAMIMAFEATETQRGSVTVGDAVAFTFRTSDDGNAIETISKQ